jgi:lysophospholipase L1-like esterase
MLLAGCGDSLTAAYVAGGYNGLGWMQQWLINNPTYTAYNFAVTGSKTSALNSPDAVYSPTPAKRICWIWSGTNDLAAGNGFVSGALSNIAAFVTARRSTGWKCVTATMLPRAGGVSANTDPFETDRQTFNSAIRANSGGIYGDAIADVGNDATIGVAGASTNATYYWSDNIHLNQAGCTLALNNYFAPAIASL